MRKLLLSELSESPEETTAIGAKIARFALGTDVDFVALFGPMGAGKTAFTRGIVSVLVPGAFVCSPTYAVVNEYRPDDSKSGLRPVFHFDMYRMTDADALDSIGFYDYLDRGGFIVTEWSENIVSELPERYFEVALEMISENQRKITVNLVES